MSLVVAINFYFLLTRRTEFNCTVSLTTNDNVMLSVLRIRQASLFSRLINSLKVNALHVLHEHPKRIYTLLVDAHNRVIRVQVLRSLINKTLLAQVSHNDICSEIIGNFLAMKGASGEEELAAARGAIKKLGGAYKETRTLHLPGGDTRTLILCQKISQTPTAYPRNGGKIAKSPLK